MLITAHGDIVHFWADRCLSGTATRGTESEYFQDGPRGVGPGPAISDPAALAQEAPVIRSRVAIGANGGTILTDVLIEPIPKSESLQGLLLLTFRLTVTDTSLAGAPEPHAAPRRGGRRALDLERGVQETRESLHPRLRRWKPRIKS